jgi:hypothetical protein
MDTKKAPAAPREEEERLAEDAAYDLAIDFAQTFREETQDFDRISRIWIAEKCYLAGLAAQAQAVEALEAERDRLREDLRAAKGYADQAAGNSLIMAQENGRFREALEGIANGERHHMDIARAALEVNSKPPLPGEKEKE